MTKLILVAALLVATTAPAQAHHRKIYHHQIAASYPDNVTLDGKEYKVCKAGMQDDCVQPRQAGLGFGNRPPDTAHARGVSKDK